MMFNADIQTGIPWARSRKGAACCNSGNNQHANRRAGTTFPSDTDTCPCCGTAVDVQCWPRQHRNPRLFRSRSPRKSSLAPSLWTMREALRDQSPEPLRPRPKDREAIVVTGQQRTHVAVACIGAGRARVGASGTGLLINVQNVARRLIFNFQWESVVAQVGSRQRHWRRAGNSDPARRDLSECCPSKPAGWW